MLNGFNGLGFGTSPCSPYGWKGGGGYVYWRWGFLGFSMQPLRHSSFNLSFTAFGNWNTPKPKQLMTQTPKSKSSKPLRTKILNLTFAGEGLPQTLSPKMDKLLG